MPHEPKRRHSIGRKGKRRQSIKLVIAKTVKCSNCNMQMISHAVCKNCGYYKGKQVVKSALAKDQSSTEQKENA